jgi:broad specificity phosphatase PhoE
VRRRSIIRARPRPTAANSVTLGFMTRPTIVILCRHGESQDNRARRFGGHGPTPLTERGQAQALATGRRLARLGVDVLYSSDLVRTEQTTQGIARALTVAPIFTPALRERSVGVFTGRSFEEVRAQYPDEYHALLLKDAEVRPPGGESYAECRARVTSFLQRILIEHKGSRIVCVSHYLAITQLALDIMGFAPGPEVPSLHIRIDNCALHRFELYDEGNWQIMALNDVAHLVE